MAKEVIASALVELSRFEIDNLHRIREAMISGINGERQLIDRLAQGADEETLEDLASDRAFLADAEDLVGKLLLVGLYRVVENLTKQALRHRFPEPKVKKCYRIDQLKILFTKELGSDLTKLANFKDIKELLDLTNTVKHGGEFAEPALRSFERLLAGIGSYLHDLAVIVIP